MEKILLVDDNNVSLSLAKNMLGDKYEIYAVISGEQALKFLEKKDVDLILLDINMPDMSGFETLKLIREMPEHINIPIIFLTSDADPETERKCFEMGALTISSSLSRRSHSAAELPEHSTSFRSGRISKADYLRRPSRSRASLSNP